MFQFEEVTATTCKAIPTLNSDMVCERFSIGERTLYRWQDAAAFAFAEPLYLLGRRYWHEREVVDWETRTFGERVFVGRSNKRPSARPAETGWARVSGGPGSADTTDKRCDRRHH